MGNEIKERTCRDCIYYKQHYGKDKTRYHPVDCGHCRNKPKGKPYRNTDKICDCFEEKNLEEIKKSRQASVIDLLENVRNILNELSEVLKDGD